LYHQINQITAEISFSKGSSKDVFYCHAHSISSHILEPAGEQEIGNIRIDGDKKKG
jgi:hypothetical protein